MTYFLGTLFVGRIADKMVKILPSSYFPSFTSLPPLPLPFLSPLPPPPPSPSQKNDRSYLIVFGLIMSAVGQFLIGIEDYLQVWYVVGLCIVILVTSYLSAYHHNELLYYLLA